MSKVIVMDHPLIQHKIGIMRVKTTSTKEFRDLVSEVAMLICYDKNECWQREYDGKTSGDVDASIVTTHMMLEAYSLGVGTTWVMHFIPEAIIEEFSIPDNIEPIALLVMGYPDENSKPFPGHFEFKPLEDIVSYNMIKQKIRIGEEYLIIVKILQDTINLNLYIEVLIELNVTTEYSHRVMSSASPYPIVEYCIYEQG